MSIFQQMVAFKHNFPNLALILGRKTNFWQNRFVVRQICVAHWIGSRQKLFFSSCVSKRLCFILRLRKIISPAHCGGELGHFIAESSALNNEEVDLASKPEEKRTVLTVCPFSSNSQFLFPNQFSKLLLRRNEWWSGLFYGEINYIYHRRSNSSRKPG